MAFTEMKSNSIIAFACLLQILFSPYIKAAPASPVGLVSRSGDSSIVLHWDRITDTNLAGYFVYRALSSEGPFIQRTSQLLTLPSYADLDVTNNQTYFYEVAAQAITGESSVSAPLPVTPHLFASEDEFLTYVQQTSFDYFWYAANPLNGMVPDRSAATSPCSIAAVGFGLTAIGIGIDHGWITRDQGRQRVLTTLKTFSETPQGTGRSGTIGNHGWFYHFLGMNTATRYTIFSNVEVSSIDTAWLLTGALYAKQYFDSTNADEVAIRTLADSIYQRIDWNWMARNTNVLSMGWIPESNFINSTWVGYNEAMALIILGMGAPTNALPATAWTRWTSGYTWKTNYGLSYIPFAPLFGHQYSHCWIDFRHISDSYLNAKSSTYFENSRRATLAQRAFCIANPGKRIGYGSNVWGLTACDGPTPTGYAARGAPPPENDDGTIAPTAAGGSMPFTPEYSAPTLRYFYDNYRTNIWTGFGFRDAFNLSLKWWDTDVLGIDQGPIVIMIENYRTQKVWRLFMQNQEIQRGLQQAGFVNLIYASTKIEPLPNDNSVRLLWQGGTGRGYQVEYSPDLNLWNASPTGNLIATNALLQWIDSGPPATDSRPFSDAQKFYRVFQFGAP